MRVLFYFGHPAQYLFARETIRQLQKNKQIVKIVIKSKDVLSTLIENDGFEFDNILPKERGNSKLSIIFSLLKRFFILLPIVIKFKPDIMIGTDATIAQLGSFLNINRITILEDDYLIIKKLADITYPFTQSIFCPKVCDVGKWGEKKIGYDGYMKLGYLHPSIFKKDASVVKKYNLPNNYVLIRLAKLTAHHDFGISGINTSILDKLIEIFEEKLYKVLLSTEGKIDDKYNSLVFDINPNDMHQILLKSSMLICDSQSMSVEASILGIPSIRVSSFAGKISVLEELENKYNLTFGINPNDTDKLFIKLFELLDIQDLKTEFANRCNIMLADKINVSEFFTWFIENYPNSIGILKENPEFQNNFK